MPTGRFSSDKQGCALDPENEQVVYKGALNQDDWVEETLQGRYV